MNTPFETLPKEEQQEWQEAYAGYVKRTAEWNIGKTRPFSQWITDFGYTHKEE